MDLTNTQRVFKLIKNLIIKPKYIYPYLRYSIFCSKTSLELNMAWWSFEAIDKAKDIIKNKKVFEYGSGGSTLMFSNIAKNIVSVEDDKIWFEKIKDKIKNKKNIELLFRPFDFKKGKNFLNSSFLKSIDTYDWDVLIIDCHSFNERITIFNYIQKFTLKNKVIILDDFWKLKNKILKNNKSIKFENFESVGPARYGVTSTAFFYY